MQAAAMVGGWRYAGSVSLDAAGFAAAEKRKNVETLARRASLVIDILNEWRINGAVRGR
jgi:hypothetical protein